MQEGTIVQQGEIHHVFQNPGNKFIAEFVGIKNFFRATVEKLPGKQYKAGKIDKNIVFALLNSETEGEAVITIDARNIILSEYKLDSTALNNFKGTISEIVPTHSGMEVILQIGVELAVVLSHESFNRLRLEKGKEVWASFKASAISIHRF
jgi:molybdopterin-binding protein